MPSQHEPVRVLVVDDKTIIADTLVLILHARGCEALAAYSAEEAITAAKELNPQAVVTDVVMPGMNGIELADYFAEHYPACKVLLMSGNIATGELLEESHRNGRIYPIFAKPIHPAEILEFVKNCSLPHDGTPKDAR
jgi:DNA-binding NtrC family response regulator